jgi:hypothetical protein
MINLNGLVVFLVLNLVKCFQESTKSYLVSIKLSLLSRRRFSSFLFYSHFHITMYGNMDTKKEKEGNGKEIKGTQDQNRISPDVPFSYDYLIQNFVIIC